MIWYARQLRPISGLGCFLLLIFVQTACASKEKEAASVEVFDQEPVPSETQEKGPVDEIARTPEPASKPIIRKVPSKSHSTKPGLASKAAEAPETAEATDGAEASEVAETHVVRVPSGAAALNTRADNSRMNRLHDGDPRLSAEQQGNSKQDIEITRSIRRKITRENGLSIYARNVKIITRDGRVVLIGPVRSEEERLFIEQVAVEIAGIENVTSGLAVVAR